MKKYKIHITAGDSFTYDIEVEADHVTGAAVRAGAQLVIQLLKDRHKIEVHPLTIGMPIRSVGWKELTK